MSLGGRDPRSSSNLSNVFSNQPKGKTSLTYQAPTKPKSKSTDKPKESSNAPALLIAETGCSAYKYNKTEKKYDNLGKAGGAVLGNVASQTFHLLIYKKATEHLCKVPITPNFKFTVQNQTYGSFTDQDKQTWSLRLSSYEAASRFAMQICIAKALAANLDHVVTQDVEVGSGQAIEDDDEVKISYSGFLVTDGKIGKMFDSNVSSDTKFRFKVGGGKVVKGMDDGVVGMKKKGRRIVAIPPQYGYKDKAIGDSIPANSTLVFQIDLEQIKFKNSESSKEDLPQPEEIKETSTTREDVLKRAEKIGESIESPQTPQTPQQPQGYPNQYGQYPPNPYGQYGPPPFGQPPGYPNPYGQFPPNPYGQYGVPPQPYGMQYQPQYNQYGQPQNSPQAGQQLALVNSDPQTALIQQQLKEEQKELQKQLKEQKEALEAAQRALSDREKEKIEVIKAESVPEKQVEDLMVSLASNRKFLNETKRLHSDINTAIVGASNKVEQLHKSIQGSIFGQSKTSQASAHGLIIVQTIQKYIEDNEQLQNEVNQKAERIDSLREKLTALLEKNKELIEQQTKTMEERNNNLSYTSDKTRQQISTIREQKTILEEELNNTVDALSKDKRTLTQLSSKNQEILSEVGKLTAELQALRDEVNDLKKEKNSDSSAINTLRSDLKEEQAVKKTIRTRTDAIEEELLQIAKDLKKNKSLFEARKKKWLQVKQQIENNYEEEKQATVKRVKQQLLKFKKEKEDAIAQMEVAEKETEEKWQGNVQILKERFKERVEQLKEELISEKEVEIQESVSRVESRVEKLVSRTELATKKAYEQGKQRGFEVQKPLDSNAHSRQLTQKLNEINSVSKDFMMKHVKSIMNMFYFNMRDTFDADTSYSNEEALAILMNAVKEAAGDALQQIDDDFRMSLISNDQDKEEANSGLDVLDLGLDENQMNFDLDNLCQEFQIMEENIILPKKEPEPEPEPEPEEVVEVIEEVEEVEEEEVDVEREQPIEVEDVDAEEETNVDSVEPSIEEEPETENIEPEPLVEDVEYEEYGETEEEVEEVVEEIEEEVEVDEVEEVDEITEEDIPPPDVEVEDEVVEDEVVENPLMEEEEEDASYEEIEVEEEVEVEEVESEDEPEPEPEPEQVKKPTRKVPDSIFGDDEDPLFGSISLSKPSTKAEPNKKKELEGEDDFLSKFSSSKPSRSALDLFGDGEDGDLFGTPAKTSKNNLADIFGSSPAGSNTNTKDLFSF